MGVTLDVQKLCSLGPPVMRISYEESSEEGNVMRISSEESSDEGKVMRRSHEEFSEEGKVIRKGSSPQR